MGGTVSEPAPQWKVALAWDLTMNAYKWDHGGDSDALLETVLPHIEAAYQRGLMAGRSQSGYATRRKPRKEPQ
jgi:hypothetical protein